MKSDTGPVLPEEILKMISEWQSTQEIQVAEGGQMKLERRFNESEYPSQQVEYIYPLEELKSWKSDKPIPTEQGELLLEFIRRQLIK